MAADDDLPPLVLDLWALPVAGRACSNRTSRSSLGRNVEWPTCAPDYDGDQAASQVGELGPSVSTAGICCRAALRATKWQHRTRRSRGRASPITPPLVTSHSISNYGRAPRRGQTHSCLDDIASRRLANIGGNAAVPVLRCYGEELVTQLEVGDTVPVDVDYGWLHLHGTWRVVQIDLYPDQGDVLDATLNPPLPVLG